MEKRHYVCEYQHKQFILSKDPEAKEKDRLATLERKRKYRERIGKEGRRLENQKQAKYKSEWHKKKREDVGYVEKRLDYAKNWRSSSGGKKYHREYMKEKRKTDPLFACKARLRSRMNMFFRNSGYAKPSQTEKLLGIDWGGFKTYFEKLFVNGMSWDNRDLWHIDHVIPLNSAKTIEELEKLCHYTNLQPLWIKDNLIKGASHQPLSEPLNRDQ